MNERETLLAALARNDAQARSQFLDQACAGDAALRDRIDSLLKLHEQTTDNGTPPTADFDATTDGPTGPLDLTHGTTVRYFGDYEILKELGRGGMGVVYGARQISLNRPVAVKMIKAGILADIAELQRFQNEAEAVALLDHAGIVPVYEVGEHDGQRYFSMKLVDGGNLADQIDSFQTNFRAAATLVVETAEAVHHAHMRGILHRDLKPANILIDAEGHPHVTDFGLAKRVEGDVDLTASGAIMGTPAYMSPEQAFGRRHSITTATDVYGLGAILYALLTGKAPFGGDSAIETIDAVRNRPPEPPRMKNGQVPRDLETICLKCLEKDPRRRYASATGMADDLKAWLDSRPISARRVGAAERAWLWSRRKPAVAALAAAVVVAVVGGTTGILAVQAGANANLLVAYNQLDRANVALQSSNTLLEKQRARAEDREQQAIDAVKKFRDAVADNPELKDNPSLESLRKTLLKEPLAYFRSLRASLQADRDTRPESLARLAKAIHEYAHLTDEIGDTQDGLRSHEESLAIWEKLTADHPLVPEYQYGLGRIHNCRGNMLVATGQLGPARKAHETALAIQQNLADAHPSVSRYQSDLAAIHNNLGNLLGTTGQPDAARKAYEAALAIRQRLADANPSVTEYQWHLATSHFSLGFLLDHIGQPGAARKAFEDALLIQQQLADLQPSVTEFQRSLATIHGSLANLLRASGQHDAARKAYDAAGAIFQKLADLHPSVSRYQSDLAKYHYNLGTFLSATGHPEAARKAYEAALEIRRKLADAHSSVTEYQSDLGKSYYDLGVLLRATGQPEAARKADEAALPIWERLAREHPETPDYASRLGGLLHNIAVIDLDARRFDETRDRLQQAIVWQKRAVAINPRNPQFRRFLTNHLNSMISTAEALGRNDLAAAAHADLAKLEATDPRLESLDARLVAVLNGEATKSNAERLTLARRAYDTQQYASAAKLWAEALKSEPKIADDRQAGHRYNAACAAALAGCGQGKDNPAPNDATKATLREQARDFLQTELATWTRLLDSRAPQAQPTVVRTLKHWRVDTDLAGIRDAKALEALPGAEREPWRGLWTAVDALLTRAQAAPAAARQK